MASKREGILLCYPYEEKRLHRWNVPAVITQPKLDGERCRAIIQNGNVQLISSEMNEILSVPHINQELSELWTGTVELDGELYIHEAGFEQVHSVVGRTVNLHPNYYMISYNIFDVVNALPQVDRTRWLKHFPAGSNVHVVESFLTELNHIEYMMDEFTDSGYEGIIVRHPLGLYERKRSTMVMKYKPKKTDIYEICGWEEELSEDKTPKGMIGALWCIKDGQRFKVSCSATSHEAKRRWFQTPGYLLGMCAVVHYQNLTNHQVPRFGRLNLEIDLTDACEPTPVFNH